MLVYRITRKKYLHLLNGEGSALSRNNRWNSFGTRIIYTAESMALARAELATHVTLDLVSDPVMITMEIPDDYLMLTISELNSTWSQVPPNQLTQKIGDDFIFQNKQLTLSVPSRVDFEQRNYLLNPSHKDFKKVQFKDYLDLR